MGVMAADVSGDVISTSGADWQTAWDTLSKGGNIIVTQGNSIDDTSDVGADYGLNFTNNLVVGQSATSGTSGRSLYVIDNANSSNVFSIQTVRDVSVGALLQVLNSWDLTIGSPVFADGITNASVTVGNIDIQDTSSLTLQNLKSVSVSGTTDIASGARLDMQSVGVVGMGDVAANGVFNVGVVQLDQTGGAKTTGDFSVGGLYLASGANISAAGDINVAGTLQNVSVASSVDIVSDGNIFVAGNLENSGANMTIGNGVLTVNGVMKNDYVDGNKFGKLVLSGLQSWQVGQTGNPQQFINSADFEANVEGLTNLTGGLNLSGMSESNTFFLETGQIDLGSNNNIYNKSGNFTLQVTGGDLNLATVTNESGAARLNLSASGILSASYIFDQAVTNSFDMKSMNISANVISLSNLNVSDTVLQVGSGANVSIIAEDSLTANGAVSNTGKLFLGGNTVNTGVVSNAGGLTVKGDSVTVNEIANDSGNVLFGANNVIVTNSLTNSNDGVFDITADTVSGGDIDVFGGVVSVNADSLDVSQDINVNGGALNVNVADVTANAGINAGNVVLGAVNNVSNGTNLLAKSVVLSTDGSADINMGSLSALDYGFTAQFVSNDIGVQGDAYVATGNTVIFGDENATATSGLNITGNMAVESGANVEIYSNTTGVGSLSNSGLITAHGNSIVATGDGGIDIAGSVGFNNSSSGAGLSVVGPSLFVLQSTYSGANVNIGAVNVDTDKKLYLDSQLGGVSIAGAVDVAADGLLQINTKPYNVNDDNVALANVGGKIDNTGIVSITAGKVSLQDVINNTNAVTNVFAGTSVSAKSITNSGVLKIAYVDLGSAINSLNVSGNIINNAGTMDLLAKDITAAAVSVNAGNLLLHVPNSLNVTDMIYVNGSVNQGGAAGALNLVGGSDDTETAQYSVFANDFSVTGDFIADTDIVSYNIDNNVSIAGDLTVESDATVAFDVMNKFSVNDLFNYGDTTISADGDEGFIISGVIENASGVLDLDSGAGYVSAGAVTVSGGNVILDGAGITTDGMFKAGILGQGTEATSVIINADEYVMDLGTLYVDGISQKSGSLTINSSDIEIWGDVYATDLRFAAYPINNWMQVEISGDVSGNVDFIGLERMHITGDYEFNNNSALHAFVLPYATGEGSTTNNHWADVSLTEDETLGQITNSKGASALINVNGKFTSDLTLNSFGNINVPFLEDAQIGIDVVDIVDVDTAIWLLYAEQGVYNLDANIRNVNVKFCNEDGSICVPYFSNMDPNNPDGLPAYVSVRDTDGNSIADSLYIVFDNRFGGPVQVFGVQPIVARQASHTFGQYLSAGALDNMVAGQLENKKFFNRTPIELIPIIFEDTNLSMVANELYNRMENYVMEPNGAALTNFTDLFENYELEQVAGILSLNEHTAFRSFEDRMVDEFIWNRNRNLKKAWLDTDYGMFYQNTFAGRHTDGNRFSIAGGFDWQESNTLMLGLTGRVSHTSSKLAKDNIDLSYANIQQIGQIDTTVSDTNVGLGGYLMKILGEKYRMYGNLMMDVHVFDIQREQTFVDTIDGSGTAFGLTAEFGLLHDILNQYIVGNLYARVGYNFGFDVTEKAAGSDYMHLKSDGYAILTPGYSLTAQKRIYPSAWFQIRPYASIGIEYDVSGMPDSADYKFATANAYSEYDLALDPLWANIGGGVELLSARGMQFGLDYRYQYNEDLQLHNIKVSGSYRF